MNIKYGFICCGYNCVSWVNQSMYTMLNQEYKNFKIICMDAQSTDGTYDELMNYQNSYPDIVSVHRNEDRKYQVENTMLAAKMAEDCDVLVTVDLDDFLANAKVLNKLNEVYSDPNVWMTYGSYCHFPYQDVSHHYHDYPEDVKRDGTFKAHPKWLSSHLRTFKRKLFLNIKDEDLRNSSGNYIDMAGDAAFMYPMLEMARERTRFIPDILYIYNRTNPLSEDRVDVRKQEASAAEIKSKPINERLVEL
jgi:glycosyltransferase involved in cell wall biosynthesis